MTTSIRRPLLAPFLSLLVVILAAAFPARAQCGRVWQPYPNGVYDANGDVGVVHAMTSWDPDGAGPLPAVLVVAGSFTRASDTFTYNIAYWDGASWRALGNGLTGTVYVLAVLANQLYAGGSITGSGPAPLNNFVRWTGNGWENVLGGVDGQVKGLVVDGQELIVGGWFNSVGGGAFPYQYVARYVGGAWQTYPVELTRPVAAVAVRSGRHVVMYERDSQDNQPILRWNTTLWSTIGVGNGSALGVSDGDLFYTNFTDFQASNCWNYRVMRFDGNYLHLATAFHIASAFTVHNGELYVVGSARHFCPSSGPSEPWLGRWNGLVFDDVTPHPGTYGVNALCSFGGQLHIGGTFDKVGYAALGYSSGFFASANAVAQLTGGGWNPLANQLNGVPRCSTNVGDALYIGGDFTASGGEPLGHIAYYNGQTWRPYGAFNAPVTSMRYYSPNPQVSVGAGLVVSGSFSQVGATAVNRIAMYNNSTGLFDPMGSGLNGPALAMMQVGVTATRADLVVGGQFTTPGSRIARWQLGGWQPMGSGMNNDVQALSFYGGGIIAGGSFTTAGGNACSRLARWDNTTWQPLGGGTDGVVRALAVYGGSLIVAGDFLNAGAASIPYIAAWNGTTWAALGAGLNGQVNALTVSGNLLIAGGTFTQSESTLVNHVASWNGTAWDSVGYSATSSSSVAGAGVDGTVLTLATAANGDLVVGGPFTYATGQLSPMAARAVVPGSLTIVGQPVSVETCPGASASFTFDINPGSYAVVSTYVWYLNGQVLVDGTSPTGTIFSHTDEETLYISNISPADAGSIWCRATTPCGGTALSDGATLTVEAASWDPVGTGMNNSVLAQAVFPNGDLAAGGLFTIAGGVAANSIARWNGSTWSPLGTGLNSIAFALTVFPNGDLAAGGYFSTAGGVAANYIARWNGSTWASLGTGMNNYVAALAVYPNGDLVAGGTFTTAGGLAANRIARWNGSTWTPLGTGMNNSVYALVVFPNGDLAAGGSFTTAGGVSANNIARWNGSAWAPLGTGMNNYVAALAVLPNGDLAAGGAFTTAGGVAANRIARWNGSTWAPLNAGMNDVVQSLAVLPNGDLAAGGPFTGAGGPSANHIARWNGSSWNPLGTGTNSGITALAVLPNGDLAAGGSFTTAGGQASAYLARWGGCPPPPCYANCDGSTTPPVLNVLDFACFLNNFAGGSPYANCDNSTTPPMLNVLDFACFLNSFAAGCP